MVSANQFRELVSEYLRGVVDLEAFSKRFAVLFDDIEDSGDADAVRVSYQIESHLADLSAGFVTEAQLRETLISCLVHVDVAIAPEYRLKEMLVKKQPEQASSPFQPQEPSFA